MHIGSPAHAGIDPRLALGLFVGHRFPRTRGDRPKVSRRGVTGDKGSPAHAGIDPGIDPNAKGVAGFPRTRGDRPCEVAASTFMGWVPPHTRG